MILNLLISLSIVIGLVIIMYFVALIIINITSKIESFIKRKKEEAGLEKWYRIDTIIRSVFVLGGMIALLTFFVYAIIFG